MIALCQEPENEGLDYLISESQPFSELSPHIARWVSDVAAQGL